MAIRSLTQQSDIRYNVQVNKYTQPYRTGAAATFIDEKLARGIWAFSLDELTAATGLSAIGARNQLLRLGSRITRVTPRQPYFLIVTPDQRAFGAPPVDRWLDDYFKWLGRPYYVALLSAAAVYGSSHQAVQVTQVMTDMPMRPIELGRIRIHFSMKSGIERTNTRQLPMAYAPLKVSTTESTIFDLIRYAPRIGGIERAAETIAPMLSQVTAGNLMQVLKVEAEITAAQRLGFVLESLGAAKLAKRVRKWMPETLKVIPLAAHAPRCATDPMSETWRVLVNAQGFQP